MEYRNINILFSFFFALMASSLAAQKIILKGMVKDTSQAIAFTTVQLKSITDTTFQESTLSNILGLYQFEISRKGRYFIFASALGYKDFSDTLEINTSSTFDILLQPTHSQLQEVVIISKKPDYENDKSKLIFNVQNSALTTGQNALDMLKKLPGITVGQNDQIFFRGASGINIMIDGKMTYLSGSQVVNFLKGMSAEDIQKIELITTPSAEFDAAGNTGIINIIPKRSIKKGYAIDLRTAVSKGKYWMANENISASLRTQKLTLYGFLDFNTPHSFSQGKSGNTINENGDRLQLKRENESTYKIKYYTWRIGADWRFLSRHSITASYHGYLDDFKSYNYSTVNRLQETEALHSFINSENDLIEPYHYNTISANYKYEIDSLGKKITADANYTLYRNFSDGMMTTYQYQANGNYLNKEVLRSHQPGFVKIISAKADAGLPFRKFSIKTGIKYAEVENDNQYRFDSLRSEIFVEIEPMSNHFIYKERIAAAYLSGTKTSGKTTIEAGLRAEYTNADGYTVKQDVLNKWQYTRLFPSLQVEQIINDNNKIDFSFSRRINRPSYADLNPVRWYNDRYFYYAGNPGLVPELAWVYSLLYSLKNRYAFSAIYNHGINYINRRLLIDDNGITVKSQSANFGKRQRFDFTTSVSFKLWPFWNAQFFSDVSYTSYPISQLAGDKKLALWAATVSLQQDISLPKDFKVSLASHWYSSELRGIYITKPSGNIDFGIKRSFLQKKLDAQISINDMLNTNRYRASSQSNIVNYYYNDKPYSRIIGLSLKYHLGGEQIKAAHTKTEEQERL